MSTKTGNCITDGTMSDDWLNGRAPRTLLDIAVELAEARQQFDTAQRHCETMARMLEAEREARDALRVKVAVLYAELNR